ncbi:hypothetical protein M514_06906 [Trichuris suis]|uniref:Uncharacterized protein n=1 Tax=Trichuris suis TaxID=68888 RepID=A0A085NLL9_9BILA|nr:hypothetical protein M513_06906 [Trichuris suis]KFD70365.1 hypothetical protein M514_06906 [Trichuris suis]KHJ47876.1 hypothetical protein D918_02035 [Trichuris suis]
MAPKEYTLLRPEFIEKDLPMIDVEPRRSRNMESICFWCVAILTGVMVIFTAVTLLLEYGDQVMTSINSRLPEWTKDIEPIAMKQGDMPLVLQIIAPPQFAEGNPKILQVLFNAQKKAMAVDEPPQPLVQPIDIDLPLDDIELLPQPLLINNEMIGDIAEVAEWDQNLR